MKIPSLDFDTTTFSLALPDPLPRPLFTGAYLLQIISALLRGYGTVLSERYQTLLARRL